jgi:hypothetical protein
MTDLLHPSPPPDAKLPDVSQHRPPMYALIRAYLLEDWWTGGEILRRRPGNLDTLGIMAGGAAGMLLEACGGDRNAALTIVDHWLQAAISDAAAKLPPPA